MPSLRPSIARPTIRELTTYLFSPPQARCLSALQRPLTRRSPQIHISLPSRTFTASHIPLNATSRAPKSHDRGPTSKEDTQTDFGALNVLGNTPAPSTSIDACAWDGFHLNNGVKIIGGKGILLVNGEAFEWSPWLGGGKTGMELVNAKGQWDVSDEAWGLLGLVWPKPGSYFLFHKKYHII
jgi:NADH dehydrogenase [ubiquinone] 1 alpha subcomplex assembly factor 3